MRKKIVLSITVVITICVIVFAYLLLYGKLFPYSPFHPGFEKHELNHIIVYVQEEAEFSDFARIDSLIKPVEEFHELKFLHKPSIFIFRDRQSYLRRSPSKARLCAFYNGDIVISPWAIEEDKEGKISLDIYLRHELSHSILFQNKGLLSAYRLPKWLLEGIAVYSTNQMGTSFYPSKEKTYALIKEGNFLQPNFFDTKEEDNVQINFEYRQTFFYSEFACIVDYMINTYSRDSFIKYVKLLLKENDSEEILKEIYNKNFHEIIYDFRKYVEET